MPLARVGARTECQLQHGAWPTNCRGQCFDGAANMAGRRAGVATKIRELESRAICIHCMGHSMNLAVQDTCRSIAVMAD